MDFKEVVQSRRSVRKYTDQEISESDIREIVRVSSYSPSWKNSQTVSYIVVKDEDVKKKIAEDCVCGFQFNTATINRCNALCVVVVDGGICGYEEDGSFSTSKGDGWEMFDAGIASQTFCLAARELGIGTVILGYMDEAKLREVLGLSENKKPSALIAMGYPEKEGKMPQRKTVDELLKFV